MKKPVTKRRDPVEYLPFKEARTYAQSLGLKSSSDWQVFVEEELRHNGKLPDGIPMFPQRIYKADGWKGWSDWLIGTMKGRRSFRPFEEARTFVHGLGLRNGSEWKSYCRGGLTDKGLKPDDIPHCPHAAYKNHGWISLHDWLGPNAGKRFRKFTEARSFVHGLNLRNSQEWRLYCSKGIPGKEPKPKDIPRVPQEVYRDEWVSIYDWLGYSPTRGSQELYWTFEDAREYVRKLKLGNTKDWSRYSGGHMPELGTRPIGIPSVPEKTYAEHWVSWQDWLGTPYPIRSTDFRPFAEARAFTRKLGLRNPKEWELYAAGRMPEIGTRPPDIPNHPRNTYRKEWKSWPDWLGYRARIGNRESFLPFAEARSYVRALKLKNRKEWRDYSRGALKRKRPVFIPSNPDCVYRDEWVSFADWLAKD